MSNDCSCNSNTSRPTRNRWALAALSIIGGCAVIASGVIATSNTTATAETAVATQEAEVVLIRLETTKGNIDIELNREKAPISVDNFLQYIDDGHYNGTIFHRVMPGFMIQGGGFDETMTQKPVRDGIKNEWENGLSNVRGSIAMARLGRQPDSGTAQFFINVVDNGFLDQPRDGAGYAVFGKVTEGMDVVDEIVKVRTTNKGPHQNVPVEAVIIKKAVRLADEKSEQEDG